MNQLDSNDVTGSMEISIEERSLGITDPAIACAVVCCCAIATICVGGCVLAN